jgi:hypothetical protein
LTFYGYFTTMLWLPALWGVWLVFVFHFPIFLLSPLPLFDLDLALLALASRSNALASPCFLTLLDLAS